MNEDTGRIKLFNQLTEEEKKSGKWKPFPEALKTSELSKSEPPKRECIPARKSKSELKREEYMKRVLNRIEEKAEVSK